MTSTPNNLVGSIFALHTHALTQVVRACGASGWAYEFTVRPSSDASLFEKYNIADFVQVRGHGPWMDGRMDGWMEHSCMYRLHRGHALMGGRPGGLVAMGLYVCLYIERCLMSSSGACSCSCSHAARHSCTAWLVLQDNWFVLLAVLKDQFGVLLEEDSSGRPQCVACRRTNLALAMTKIY
jgi:hypothetical protein